MILGLFMIATAPEREVRVADLGSIRAAVVQAKAGDRILIAPGRYAGGVYATNLHGPITIAAQDPKNPPVFTGAIQFQEVTDLTVKDLRIEGVGGNAIGIDDGGKRETPARNITLENLTIVDVPGDGSNGIKLAGVDAFHVVHCTVMRWGGCAVDMVGCHRGNIVSCHFEKGGGVGVQAKGSSRQVRISYCDFVDYGGRGVNIGGSTGIPYFRPALETVPAGSRFEAKEVEVEHCTFLRGAAPVAFAGADSSVFSYNTIAYPERWALRILQETSTPDFVQCRNGRFEDNLVLFRSDQWLEGGVNIGPNTLPQTFKFARNWWYCTDKPDRSSPTLPSKEVNPSIGEDPRLTDPANGNFAPKPGSRATKVGAAAPPPGRG